MPRFATSLCRISGAVLPLAAVLLAAPAVAEISAQTDTGMVIELAAETTASPADAWKALIAPAQWWSGEHTYSGVAENLYLDAQATGCFCEKLPVPAEAPAGQRMGSIEHMHIIYADPARGVLRMAGGLGPLQSEAVHGTLTVQIKPKGQGARIEWTYVVGGYMRFKVADVGPAVDRVLGQQLASLAAKASQSGGADAVR